MRNKEEIMKRLDKIAAIIMPEPPIVFFVEYVDPDGVIDGPYRFTKKGLMPVTCSDFAEGGLNNVQI